MTRKRQWREAGFPGVDPKLFFEFPDQRRFGRLPGFDFATGKFPQTCHRLAFGALRKQHPPVLVNQGNGGNQYDFHDR